MIIDPIYISPNSTLADAKEITDNYKISGVPVVDEHGSLIGILTNRDMRFETDLTRPVKDVMTKAPLITGRVGTSLEEARNIMNKHKIEKLPIVNEKGILKGLITIKDIQNALSILIPIKMILGVCVLGLQLVYSNMREQGHLWMLGLMCWFWILHTDIAKGFWKPLRLLKRFGG